MAFWEIDNRKLSAIKKHEQYQMYLACIMLISLYTGSKQFTLYTNED